MGSRMLLMPREYSARVYTIRRQTEICPSYIHKKFNNVNQRKTQRKNLDDELGCGVFLTQRSEEILNKEEAKAREEPSFVKTQNNELNQLMSLGRQTEICPSYRHKKFDKLNDRKTQRKKLDDELECGVFLSQRSEEILIMQETKAREETSFVKSQNNALNQLMSPGIQSLSKQTKTILFLVQEDSQCGQTIHNIAVNDPSIECSPNSCDVIVEDCRNNPNRKKYQCNNCKQIFDRLAGLNSHIADMASQSRQPSLSKPYCPNNIDSEVDFLCPECGKRLKTREKLDRHCAGHGNKERQCDVCDKVLASKNTLKIHKRIHTRAHLKLCCEKCDIYFDKREDYEPHMLGHNTNITVQDNDTMDAEFTGSYADALGEQDLIFFLPDDLGAIEEVETEEVDDTSQVELQEDNPSDVIAKVIASEMFLGRKSNKAGGRRSNKSCVVCFKHFGHIANLKRHLIQHVIRSTLNKTPVDKNGTLDITCDVCQAETFHKIDKYKAHLREHAKLTLYLCNLCNKSYSDSSNFSKHKKSHGDYLQCDLCQRKFSLKKKLILHMEYHRQNPPLPCRFCNEEFHYLSALNKHIQHAHYKDYHPKFRCQLCLEYFSSLKKKWDHDWEVHNLRKMIVDCLVCDIKFRKYSDLKLHFADVHGTKIPKATTLLH